MPLPAAVQGTRIKGHYYDYSCVEIAVDGGLQPRITEINYSQKLDPGILRGTSAMMQGRTRGTYETSGSLTIYKEDYEFMKPALAAKGGGGFMLAVFDISVVFSATGMPQNEDQLMGCRITNEEYGFQSGNDPLMVKLELSIMKILTNGLSAVDQGSADNLLGGIIPGF